MKLFLAIDLPLTTKKALSEQLQDMQEEYKVFNWVRPENLHMMIHPFGEVADPKNIIAKIKELLFDQSSFYLYATRLDYFMDQQITIFTDFRKEQKLISLIEVLADTFPFKENEFITHVTVARCRIPSKQQYFVLKKKIERSNIDLSFQVKELVLFESISSKKNSTYRKITSFPLLKTP